MQELKRERERKREWWATIQNIHFESKGSFVTLLQKTQKNNLDSGAVVSQNNHVLGCVFACCQRVKNVALFLKVRQCIRSKLHQNTAEENWGSRKTQERTIFNAMLCSKWRLYECNIYIYGTVVVHTSRPYNSTPKHLSVCVLICEHSGLFDHSITLV